jgi:hypothetical protein
MPPEVQAIVNEVSTDPAMKGKSIREIELEIESRLEERGYPGKGRIKIGGGPLYGE